MSSLIFFKNNIFFYRVIVSQKKKLKYVKNFDGLYENNYITRLLN